MIFLSLITLNVSGQFNLPFGNISLEEFSNKPYKPDPGADAIILSDIGIATLKYQKGFFLEFERDIRIRIVNTSGYHYADIEIPYWIDDDMVSFRASTFNIRNGEKFETQIPQKNFIIEKTSPSYNTLKFNFQDVHEGSVVEYSYKMRLRNSALSILIPWEFQSDIPVVRSTFTVSYPDAFVYKSIISGSVMDVQTSFITGEASFFDESVTESIKTWSANNVPAFRTEPYIVSKKEHLTKLTFELARVDFPNITYNDLSPTYEKLNEKLLDRYDFGTPLNTNFNSLAREITSGASDDLSKLQMIHKYVSNKVLWNGNNDFTTSFALRIILRKEKGNSADINMILISMLRSAGLKADPVILSTRSNGSLNQNSAMLQQFNYLVAAVTVGEKIYMVDATDPLRPFNLLPFNCLNNAGRVIHLSESRFVELKPTATGMNSYDYDVTINKEGYISGKLKYSLSGYSAHDIRKTVRLEGMEGYLDLFRYASPYAEISDFKLANLDDPDSDIILTSDFMINDGTQLAADKIILNGFLSMTNEKNPFYSSERKFPVDLGYPVVRKSSLRLRIPDGYSVADKPSDISFSLGNNGGKYEFSCAVNGNEIAINSNVNIIQTVFQLMDYPSLRNFYAKILQKETEMIVLKRNPLIK